MTERDGKNTQVKRKKAREKLNVYSMVKDIRLISCYQRHFLNDRLTDWPTVFCELNGTRKEKNE